MKSVICDTNISERKNDMNYSLDEQKTLQVLGINSFRDATKDKLVQLVSMLPDMSPEVAMKAIEQIPNFANNFTTILSDYKEALQSAITSEDKQLEAIINTRLLTIEKLNVILETDDLTFEQKMLVAEKMSELCDKNSIDHQRHQSFLVEGLKTYGMYCFGFLVVIGSLLGLKANVKH